MTEPDDRTTTERLIRVLVALGFDETRLRWKLLRWARRREEAQERARLAVAHVGYAHVTCGQCGKLLPRGTRTCPGCDSRLEPHFVQALRRLGLHVPGGLSVTMLLMALVAAAFARQLVPDPSRFFAFDPRLLLELGAHFPPFEREGQWWRLATAVFLHGGLLHLLFNLFALAQIGPSLEEEYGPGRTLFFFMLTGVVANVPSLLVDRHGIAIGASGAIMGCAGMAAGWGQREGTSNGRAIRNSMLRWLLFSTLIGIALPVDHSAHVAGFVAGGLLGYAFHGAAKRRGPADAAFGVAGLVLALATLALILRPPPVPYWPF